MNRLLYKIADVYDNVPPNKVYKIQDSKAHINLTTSAELQRDKAFVYFNDKIYVGVNHIVSINKIKDIGDKKRRLLYTYRLKRGTLHNIKDKISFGHVLNGNVAVIDSYTNVNCTDEEIKDTLLSNGYTKIYSGYTPSLRLVEIDRIAKK